MVDFATSAPRTIDGRDYPSLTQRQHDDATGETLDIIDVWVFQPDFDARHRVVGISIVDRRPSQVDPIPLDEIDAVVGSLDIRPVGTVLISDDLSNPGSSLLPATSDAPALYDYGYRNGGYEFVNIDPNWAHYREVHLETLSHMSA